MYFVISKKSYGLCKVNGERPNSSLITFEKKSGLMNLTGNPGSFAWFCAMLKGMN